jgi:hypothetical protein
MTFLRTPLRQYILQTNIKYHAKKNKKKYTQQPIKRQFHTNPPIPPNTPFILMLSLITGYYIYQNTRPRGPCSLAR